MTVGEKNKTRQKRNIIFKPLSEVTLSCMWLTTGDV